MKAVEDHHDHRDPSAAALARADRLPAWITDSFIERTRKLFQPRYLVPLSRDEVIRILLNVGALLDTVLMRGPHETVRRLGQSQ